MVKTQHMMAGYYRRPEVTAEMFDHDGFYRTGDIMAEAGPDQLRYIDRRSNVTKLAQGEFVSLTHLETLYAASSLIHQIYIYANSEQSFVLAVIVPSAELASVNEADIKAALHTELQRVAGVAKLQPYEIPRDFIVETEPFSQDNSLLTGVGKLARAALRARYEQTLQRIYEDIADAQARELSDLRLGVRQRPVLDTVYGAVRATLGLPSATLSPESHFIDLGGDSLAALSLATLLEELFSVEVPVATVISPTANLQQLSDAVEQQHDSQKRRSFSMVHGRDSMVVRARDLTLDKFIEASVLKRAETSASPVKSVRTVLVTGANGYLGRFLCLQWLQRLAPVGGKVICIIRGGSARAGRQRLLESFSSDAGLSAHYNELAASTLEVIGGDVSQPKLGVSESLWGRLASTVDLIVHSAALVNHVLPYRQLFGPNVSGTAELIRLAICDRLKPLTVISSVAAAFTDDGTPIVEDDDIRAAIPTRAINDRYANGYATSKWAGEILVREAHERFGLPVTVFRSDMILAHSHYSGQLNVPDLFTRLVLSLIVTGIAPRSFYRMDGDRRARAHYDGLPVDFTAETITGLGAHFDSGFRTFHVLNPHDDGISLDTFVDWLIDAGHPITRIDDYQAWFERFQAAMRALPAAQRQHSVLDLVDAFRYPATAVAGSATSADRFEEAVRAAKIGVGSDIPSLSEEFIHKYVSDLGSLGLL